MVSDSSEIYLNFCLFLCSQQIRLSLATTLPPTRIGTTPTASLKKETRMKTVKGRPSSAADELETISDSGGAVGTRIMVYVRARPLSKKEKEAGARSCVRIVNRRDVYLTEFALETDYLRLKRVRGRHFAFDASFPDNTSQQDVYNARYQSAFPFAYSS